MSDAVRRLADLAEEELGLVATGTYGALVELHERRAAALAELPAQPTDAEREVLVRTHQVQVQVAALLEKALADTAAELGRLDRGKTALQGYAKALKRT